MRILVADNHPSLRSALRFMIEQEPGYELDGEATNAAELRGLLGERGEPDIVLVDWRLPGLGGAPLVRLVRDERPEARLIVMGNWAEDRAAALAAGVDAFIGKGYPAEYVLELLRHLRVEEEKQSSRLSGSV